MSDPDGSVDLTRDGNIAILTFNRPKSLNALSGEMLARSAELATEVAEDDSIRCLVVTGAGAAFSAGGDVKAMASRRPAPEGGTAAPASQVASWEVSRQLYEMPKPTIAALRGPAAGGAMGIALSTDIRIAGEDARLVPAFARVGVSGDFGGTWLLRRLVGPSMAKEIYFRSKPIDAETALKLGLVSRVVPNDEVMKEAMALARELADGPTRAYGLMKDNFAFGSTHTFAETLQHEAENFARAARTVDHREAARAFVEKRPPQFTGS